MWLLFILTIKFSSYTINKVSAEKIDFGAVEAALKERNERVAGILSLRPNSPDNRGRKQFELAADSLERDRIWEHLESPVKKDVVEIPAGTPVGVLFEGYVTTKILRGILASTDRLIGGAGYMEHGRRRKDALSLVTVSLGEGAGTIDLLVPSWQRSADGSRYTAVLQKSLGNSPIALIA
jgi:hypothetical protein